MSRIEPKFAKNERVEFVLRDDAVKSGYSHHCGYVKRYIVKERLFRKPIVLYDVCEAGKDERYLWHNIPEDDILGVVEYQKKDKQLNIKPHKKFNELKNLEELK